MKSLKFLIPLGAFIVLAVLLAVGLRLDPREVPSPLIGKPVPSFTLARLEKPDATVSNADLRGKVWMLNVWASWCAACRDEHPVLVEFSKRKLVPIYGLNHKDERADGLAWLAKLGNPYETSLYDNDGRLGIDFGVYGVPETFIIDREGIIRLKHIGPITPEVFTQRIEPMLKTLQSSPS